MLAVIIIIMIAVLLGLIYTVLAVRENSKDIEITKHTTEEVTTPAEEETIPLEEATVDEVIGNMDDEVSEEEVKKNDALPYFIKVNRAQNCITIYQKDKNGEYTIPYKAMVCSTGKYVGNTPLGEFKTLRSYEWLLMVDGSYGQFAYRYYGSILFHSVPYYSKQKDDLEYKEFNKLGSAASLGCVRVCVRDAIWLIENCPVGTQVIVYDDKETPGPLGKPEMIKIPEDSPNRGWDPTDPDPENPWHNCKPEINVEETVKIAIGKYSMDNIVERIGATATDTCGNDITDEIKAGGSIRFDQLGSNTLVLSVKDAIGKTDVKVITIVVEETEVTTAKPTTKQPETTRLQETTTEEITETISEETTTLPSQETQPSQPVQPTGPSMVQPTTTPSQQETTAKSVTLNMNATMIEIFAGEYKTMQEVAKVIGCLARYSDGTVVEDALPFVAVVSGTYNLNKKGAYVVQYRYADASGCSSKNVSVIVNVIEKEVILNVKNDTIEVTAGEYQKVSDIFSKMGITAVDSRGNTINNAAAQVEYTGNLDINVEGTYALTLTITDIYGVVSGPVEVVLLVKNVEE